MADKATRKHQKTQTTAAWVGGTARRRNTVEHVGGVLTSGNGTAIGGRKRRG